LSSSVRIFAPATVANVACGYDIMGFAVHEPGDEVEMVLHETGDVAITDILGDNGKLPRRADQNTVGIVVQHYLSALNLSYGASITLHKNMPLGSGLGSSASSAVAGLFAINELVRQVQPEKAMSRKELLPIAMEGERLACGAAHADNVAPSLMGGFVLVRSYHPLDVIQINTPAELYCTLIHPHLEVNTKDARNLLKKNLPLEDAIKQWGNTAGLIAGLLQEDYELIGRSIEDVIVEPVRSILIPGYDTVKEAALEAGALGCGISGSGPSMFALSRGKARAEAIATAMQQAFKQLSIDGEVYVSAINSQGPQIKN
jgi:homoserine kinase